MIIPEILDLIERGALFVVNHSGGKDSQAMYLKLRDIVPREQIVNVHADLGRVEWNGAAELIRATTEVPLHLTSAHKTLLDMVEHNHQRHLAAGEPDKPVWPSPSQRQCTSDLKRGPIERTIRNLVYLRKERGERGWNLVVNCMGMRAQESPNRAKLTTFKLSKKNSVAGREWYDWLPIHGMQEDEVFKTISDAGQKPHIVYSLGMRRFSCVFCIMACEEDLKTAARLATERPELLNDPGLYRAYVEMERSTGQVMMMPKNGRRRTLEEITGVKLQ